MPLVLTTLKIDQGDIQGFSIVSVAQPKIVILLASRNGAEYLQQQLDSFRAQSYSNWELQVSDDGSTDSTIDVLKAFAESIPQPVTIRQGPRQGFWQNFMSLVRNGEIVGDLFAYSDQDDIWFSDKLARAVAWFETRDLGQPALYFTRTELIEADGTSRGYSPLFSRLPGFQNALVQNIGGGNTMVFNAAARHSLRATPVDASIVAHDWWTYQVTTGAGGVAHYDPRPSLQYRQHGENLIGANVGLRARLIRLHAFAGGRVVMWNEINLKLLDRMRSMLTRESIATLDFYTSARRAVWPRRLWLVWRSRVYRQRRVETLGLYLGALFGKL
ncbi:glycosyltransferase family 2 protein [Bradyrhizobium sp. AZCC 2230]|uniref:glycosyltransferase family 2 protein n=1 Tax=Bradyrhizobium sp. AZCC 2230 TaxID=3117021 RepID=UPI002FF370B6